jgi:carboxypeptidase family protein
MRLLTYVGSLLLLSMTATAGPLIRRVSGTVTDQCGLPLKGAVVQIENTTLLGIRSYITPSGGTYHFSGLSLGADYRLNAIYQGAEGSPKTLSQFDSSDAKILNLEVRVREPESAHKSPGLSFRARNPNPRCCCVQP